MLSVVGVGGWVWNDVYVNLKFLKEKIKFYSKRKFGLEEVVVEIY